MKKTYLILIALLLCILTSQAQWTQTLTGQSDLIDALCVVNDNVIWVKDQQGDKFSITKDAGKTWTTKNFPAAIASNRMCGSLSAVTDKIAFVIVSQPSETVTQGVYKTIDGGDNWTRQTSAFTSLSSFPDLVYFWNENEGVAIGDYISNANGILEIYTTTNGGSQWNSVAAANMPSASSPDVSFNANSNLRVRGNTIYVMGGSGTIYKSTNKGLNWSSIVTPTQSGGNASFDFKDENNGLLSSYDGGVYSLYSTNNGGSNWAKIDTTSMISEITYIPTINAYFSTNAFNGLSYSTDNGVIWTKHPAFVNVGLRSVGYSPSGNIYIGGWSYVYNTTVGGDSWSYNIPAITSFSPESGAVGTLLTITGTNLGNPKAFSIGGATAIVVYNTGTTLVGLVMPGAVTGAVSLTTIGGTSTGSSNFTITPTPYPSAQQGSKLVGSGVVGRASQGRSVSISSDGNTAIVGGPNDNNGIGAAWVYTRSGGVWTQQGDKLVGTGAIGSSAQGQSVSISSDGNSAIVGGPGDNNAEGAAWVFTRSDGVWTQEGSKLVGTGAVTGNYLFQGTSVSISSDGNTAIVGGQGDNSNTGAAWVYTRSGGVWSQQSKLVGTGAIGAARQGESVSISSDGNTAILGGYYDNNNAGAVWIFTRSVGVWTQQGNKLVGTGAVGAAGQGFSVSLSSDGNTAIVGGYYDNNSIGAAWVYTRSGGVWSQQGSKLVGTGAIGSSAQGQSVSLSSDGNTAIVGSWSDNSGAGASWVYTRSGGVWTQMGSKLVGTGAENGTYGASQGCSVSLSSDGSTAIIGGLADDNAAGGAAWVFAIAPTITYYVTVPAGTNACYIAGTMNVWTQQAMTKVDATHYTIDIASATVNDTYKYCSGPGWAYVEKDAGGNEISNRSYSPSDIVEKWASVFTDVKNSFSANDMLYGGKSFIRVQFDGNATINVYTLTGILLKQANATSNITIDNLKAGIYIVTINKRAYKVPVE